MKGAPSLTSAWTAARVLWRLGGGHPVLASLNVINRCNERCPMCAVCRDPAPMMSLAELDRLFADLKRAGILVVEVSGGEPLLRPDLFEVLTLLDARGLAYTLNTNGTLLDGETAARLRACKRLLQVAVSLDSLDRERYADLRGADLLPAALEGIEALRGALLRAPIKLSAAVSRTNWREWPSLLRFAMEKGLFLSVFPVVQGASLAHRRLDQRFQASPVERKAMARLFRRLARMRRAGWPLWEYSGFYLACADFVEGKILGPCGAGHFFVDVRSDGRLAPCVDLPAFADLKREGISEALARLPERSGEIQACFSSTPCCYTCTVNVAATAHARWAFAWESARVLWANGRRAPQ